MKTPAIILSALALLGAPLAQAEVQSKEITYTAGNTEMKGYLAWDDAIDGKRPGVLVVHEWWGHNDYARERARQLAALGYVALAVDMYGDGKTADHPSSAGEFSKAVMSDMDAARARFKAAMEQLNANEFTDATKTAAIGYCFGGAIVLNMARLGVDLDAVVSFHGSLGTQNPAEEGKVSARVLVCNGADDKFVSAESIDGFHQEMNDAGIDYQFESYDGAVHGFTNPGATALGEKFSIPLAYNEAADMESWAAMQKLFAQVFGKQP